MYYLYTVFSYMDVDVDFIMERQGGVQRLLLSNMSFLEMLSCQPDENLLGARLPVRSSHCTSIRVLPLHLLQDVIAM